MAIQGVIFDLDGTLVDSGLDFDAMRSEMGLPAGTMVLESIEAMPEGSARRLECQRILDDHETEGARTATLIPGVGEFLRELEVRELRRAILTRNARAATDLVLERLGVAFDPVFTRDEVPSKPDPTGLLRVCRSWGVSVDEVLFVGDFRLDLEAGANAGIRTVLYAPGQLPDYADLATFTIGDFREAASLL